MPCETKLFGCLGSLFEEIKSILEVANFKVRPSNITENRSH